MSYIMVDIESDGPIPGDQEWIRINSKGKPVFISDNNGFDWMFICWYFHHFIGENPFSYTSRRLSDLFCGLEKDTFAKES